MSEDIEMVTLGARLLEKNIPARQWAGILAECSKKPEVETLPLNLNLRQGHQTGSYTYKLVERKWDYDIIKDKHRDIKKRRSIVIKPMRDGWGSGLWSQFNTASYKPVYTIKTGRGGMNVLQKAITDFMKQKKLPQKRAVKIHNKTQHK